MQTQTEQAPGRDTSISKDPIGVDPIGNDPLDLSDAPPRKDEGPNRTVGGWLSTATGVFTMVVVLAVIMVVIIFALNQG
jgi:hypothetical protein